MEDPNTGATENIASLIEQINTVLKDDNPSEASDSDTSFDFPVAETLNLMPRKYLRDEKYIDDTSGTTISITMDNLYEQLAHGKVTMPISELAFYLPMHLIYRAALDDSTTVELPLPSVVSRVGIRKLVRHTPQATRAYNISYMDDIFTAAVRDPFASPTQDDDDGPVVMIDEPEAAQDEQTIPEAKEETVITETESPLREPTDENGEEIEEAITSHAESIPVSIPAATAPTEKKHCGSFDYPCLSALSLLPAPWVDPNAEDVVGDSMVNITLPDLFDQLVTGRISLASSVIANHLPLKALTGVSREDSDPIVDLDIKLVMDSVGLDELNNFISGPVKEYDIDWMVDPFEKPEQLPELVRKARTIKPTVIPAANEQIQATPEKGVIYEPSEEGGPEQEYNELPGNVNINAASVDELMQLEDMTRDIAEEIIMYRETNSGFKSVFQLHGIKGIGDNEFKSFTGIKAHTKRRHRRMRIAELLSIEPRRASDLALIAKAIADKSEFTASIISDREGLVLAQYGLDDICGDLSAILPKTTDQLEHNMSLAGLGGIDSVTLCVDNLFYTFVLRSNVILSVAHQKHFITHDGLALARKVAQELSWLLSVRAYAGPYIQEENI